MPDDVPPSAACPHMKTCAMYEIFQHTGTLGAWQALYCTGQYANCERYRRTAQGHPVPINLMPNGKTLNVGGKTEE